MEPVALPCPSFSMEASGCHLKGKKGAVSLTSMKLLWCISLCMWLLFTLLEKVIRVKLYDKEIRMEWAACAIPISFSWGVSLPQFNQFMWARQLTICNSMRLEAASFQCYWRYFPPLPPKGREKKNIKTVLWASYSLLWLEFKSLISLNIYKCFIQRVKIQRMQQTSSGNFCLWLRVDKSRCSLQGLPAAISEDKGKMCMDWSCFEAVFKHS